MLNSHRMFFERNRSGALRKFPVVCPEAAEDLLLDGRAIHEDGEGPPHGRIGEERMHAS